MPICILFIFGIILSILANKIYESVKTCSKDVRKSSYGLTVIGIVMTTVSLTFLTVYHMFDCKMQNKETLIYILCGFYGITGINIMTMAGITSKCDREKNSVYSILIGILLFMISVGILVFKSKHKFSKFNSKVGVM